jgi:lipoprotein-anchoring transpeptidase ErfK/SrfK
VVIGVVFGIVAVTSGSGSGHHVADERSTARQDGSSRGNSAYNGGVLAGPLRSASSASAAPPTPATSSLAGANGVLPVHVTGYPADGQTVGVGMPIIATFDTKITDARDFVKDTAVTVNGKPADGAWYFEDSDPGTGHAMEAHYRMQSYWPAYAHIHAQFDIGGVSAGPGLAFDGKLRSLDFTTGPRDIAQVQESTHQLTLTRDGAKVLSAPVSLGARNTPTSRGIKVIMSKGASICMTGPGYQECDVKYTQRLTYGGEYLHAAPWNNANIERGVDSSNGCTNLTTTDAARLFKLLNVGDVVKYPDATGPPMTMSAGYGDWNVSWKQWRTGGMLPTS